MESRLGMESRSGMESGSWMESGLGLESTSGMESRLGMEPGFELRCLGWQLHAVAPNLDRSGMAYCARERLPMTAV